MPVCVRSPLAAAAKPAHSSSAGLLSNTHPLHQSLNSGKALKNSEEARPAADFSVRFSLPRDATGRRINLRLERESLSKSPASRSSCGDEKISVRSQESVDEPLTSPIASSKGRDEEENNRKSPAEAPWKALHQHLSKLLYSASLCDMLEEGEGQSEAILEAEKTCQDHCSVPHGDTSSLNDGTWKFAMNEKIKEESMKPFWNTSTQWTSEESPAQAFVGFPSMESATHSPSTVSPTMAVWTEYMNYCAWYYLWRQEHPQSSSPWTEAAPRCSTQKGERPGEEQLAPEIHRTPRYVDRGVSPLASTMNQNQSLTDSVCRGSAAQTLCPSSNPRKVHYYSQKAPYTHGKRFVPLHFEDAKKARVSPSRFTVAKYFPSSEFETVQETGPSADTAREAVAKLQQDNYQPYRLSSRADMSLSQPPREIKTAGREKGGSALASPRLLRRDGINVARSIRGRTSREPGLSVYERKTNELRSLPPSWRY